MKATRIITISTKIANLYLILGERPILVDTGNPGNAARIIAALAQYNLHPRDLALILLTHAHGDHVGSVAEIRAISQAPVALHHADLEMARTGKQDLQPTQLLGRILKTTFSKHFAVFTPDVILDGTESLEPYGVNAHLVQTPGHTKGSISVITDSDEAIIGDVVRGSFILQNRPTQHLFCDDPPSNHTSLERLTQQRLTRLHAGHGKHFSSTALQNYFSRIQRPALQEPA